MHTIQFDDNRFDYTIVRTRRRTVAIHIDPAKGVVVRAPKRASEREIQKFLLQKAPWILKKLAEMQKRAVEMPQHTYLDGDVFEYLGEKYMLRICPAFEGSKTRNIAAIVDNEIVVTLKFESSQSIEAIIKKWYIARAREILNERVLFYSKELGVKPKKIAVRGQSKRWGSCSARGNVNLNWKLVMAPPDILDYVVAHELSHLKNLNHSAAFWQTLADVMPDYGERRVWLKKNGHRLGM